MADGFGEIALVTEPGGKRIADGAAVEVEYWCGATRYRFTSCLIRHLSPTRLRLVRPRRVHGFERRARLRHDVGLGYGCLMRGSEVVVQNLSEGGALLRLPAESPPIQMGEHREVWINLPGESPIPVVIEAVHARDTGLVGVWFASIRAVDQARIASHLDSLVQRAAA